MKHASVQSQLHTGIAAPSMGMDMTVQVVLMSAFDDFVKLQLKLIAKFIEKTTNLCL